jgi:hypothetical protein
MFALSFGVFLLGSRVLAMADWQTVCAQEQVLQDKVPAEQALLTAQA